MSIMQLSDRNLPNNNLHELSPPYEKVIAIEVFKTLNKANNALNHICPRQKNLKTNYQFNCFAYI